MVIERKLGDKKTKKDVGMTYISSETVILGSVFVWHREAPQIQKC